MILMLNKQIESGNKILRWHWAKRNKYRDAWMWLIKEQLGKLNIHPKKEKVFKCVMIISCRKRTLDYDNYITGCKPLIDSLVRCNLLYDDNAEYMLAEYEQKKMKETMTVVNIY